MFLGVKNFKSFDYYYNYFMDVELLKDFKTGGKFEIPIIFILRLILNLLRWPAFIAGSASASDILEFSDKIETPFKNLLVAKEYLETS